MINWWNIELGSKEIASVVAAIKNRNVSQGRLTEQLEQALAKLLEIPYVVCTTSGTSALMMAFIALGVGPQDEVIMSNRTFIATAHAAMILGARIRPIDVKHDRPIMDEDLIEKEINPATKVIVAVHLNGRACNMEKIIAIANKYKLPVIEDTAQANLSKFNGKYLGTLSRFGCFSLGMAKLITTGQGGFVVCRSEQDFIKLKRIRNQGVNDVFVDRNYNMLGSNFKFTDIQAAIGLVQLSKTKKKIKHQLSVYRKYKEGLKSVRCLKCVELNVDTGEIPLKAEFLCTERERFIVEMKQRGIVVRAEVPSLNEATHLNCKGSYVNSQLFSRHLLTLPSGPDQPLKNIERTIDIIKQIDSKFRPW